MSAQPHPAAYRLLPPAARSGVRQDDDAPTSDLDFDEPTLQFDEPAAPVAVPVEQATSAAQRETPSPTAPRSCTLSVAPGAVLRERYLLQQIVGTGGMSMVYRAQDLRHEVSEASMRVIAVKVLHEELREDARAIERLKREFAQMQLLAHPSVLKVFDVDVDRGVWFMTMELLEGQSLSMYLRTHRAAHPQALDVVKSCGEALQFAHERGIVHGDLKPGNVFLTSGGVRVFDFIGAADEARSDRAATPAYASPQRLAGDMPHPSDDIYSLGCVAYELLSGVHPFDRKPATVAHELGLQPTRIPSLSYRQWRALDRALAFDRRDRPASMRAFLDALLHHEPAEASPPPSSAVGAPGIIPVALPVAALTTPPPEKPRPAPAPVSAAEQRAAEHRAEGDGGSPAATTIPWRHHETLLEPIPGLSATATELPPVFETPRRRGLIPSLAVLLLAGLAILIAQRELRPQAPAEPLQPAGGTAVPAGSQIAATASTTQRAPDIASQAPAATQASQPPSRAQGSVERSTTPPAPAMRRTAEAPQAKSTAAKTSATKTTAARSASSGVTFQTSRIAVSEKSLAAVIQVKRLGASTAGRLPVRWRTEKRSAKPGEDYSAVDSGTLVLQDGQRMGAIYVPINDDDLAESDEMFIVELADTAGMAERDIGMAIVTIRDDDRILVGSAE